GGGRLADEACVGRLCVRGITRGWLQRFERLHDGEGQEQGELQLSRQSVARKRFAGDRRGELWPHFRSAISESGRVVRVHRRAGSRRTAAVARDAADAAAVDGARNDFATQNW